MTIRTLLSWAENGRTAATVHELPDDEQGFWREVASHLAEMDVPNVYTVECPLGFAELEVSQRGTYIRDGEELPSMFVVPVSNSIALPQGDYDDAYLTCINPESAGGRGNYKFYHLHQLPSGDVTAYYGRIGQASGFGAKREVQNPIPSWMFEVRKAEKATKGYVDNTQAYLGGEIHEKAEPEPPERPKEGTLYARLLAFAQKRVRDSLALGTRVSTEQVKASRRIIRTLGQRKTVSAFNRHLLQLMQVSPRNVGCVESELAKNPSDFARIVDREESLLAAMEAVASSNEAAREDPDRERDVFAEKGISVEEVPVCEADEVMAQVPHSLKGRVRRVYRVDPAGQLARHEAYLRQRALSEPDVRLMWHGSRNENWCSIVEHSLMLNPNAQITGKMFGHGIYFGYDELGNGALKSWNYTSARGSHWARGDSSTAFMGLYACAYGTPHHPDTWGSFTKEQLDSLGCDCLHAQGRTCGLQHDEVVFYDEAAVCLRYLVEFDG